MNNVFVQCELWCEEILRRVARPCCTCSRHVSAQALEDLIPLGPRAYFDPGATSAFVPGLELSVGPCPTTSGARGTAPPMCPGTTPEAGPCSNLTRFTHAYLMHETQHSMFTWPRHERPSRLTRPVHTPTRPSNTARLSGNVLPAFTNLTSTETIMSSSDRLKNRFKGRLEETHKLQTHVSSSSNILQAPIATSSSIVPTSSPSSDDSKKPFLLQTLTDKFEGRAAAWNMEKVQDNSNPHDAINLHSVSQPTSAVSNSCESS